MGKVDLKCDLRKQSITLKKFLSIYLGVDCECIKDISMTHQDVKILFPDLIRISFDDVYNNIDDLYKGQIIIVRDCYDDIAPYIRPEFRINLNSEYINFERNDNESISFNIKKLKAYELRLLCKRLKKLKKYREYREATKQLRTEKDCTHYKIKKRELKEEENKNEY